MALQEIPVVSRTQRRHERRQRLLMLILAAAAVAASFFLGMMVGERSSTSAYLRQMENYPPTVQVAPPAASAPAGGQKLTFYDDLPKGNAAPLGSGINLPRASEAPPPPPPPQPAVEPLPVAPAPAPVAPAAPAAKPAAPVVAPAKPAPVPPSAKPVATGGYVVQVASTKNQAEAGRLAERLKGKGFSATTERVDLGAKGVWYRVVVGSYADQTAAERAAAQLKKEGLAPAVRRK